MSQKKRRGRPTGGKHPEPIRLYWRTMQRSSRAAKKVVRNDFNLGKKGKKKA
jgi:hypothetical protein